MTSQFRLRAPSILIVDDDAETTKPLIDALTSATWSDSRLPSLRHVLTPTEFVTQFKLSAPDIVVVDLELVPRSRSLKESHEIIEWVASTSDAGIIVYTAVPSEVDEFTSLTIGADDYIRKPGEEKSTRARVGAVWRRVHKGRANSVVERANPSGNFLIGSWKFKVGNRNVQSVDGETRRLTLTEYQVIEHMLKAHNIDADDYRQWVLDDDQKTSYFAHDKDARLDNLVYRLRRKFGMTLPIETLGGGRYRLGSVQAIGT